MALKEKNKTKELQAVVIEDKSVGKRKQFMLFGIAAALIVGIAVIFSITVFGGGNGKKLTAQLNLGNKYLNELDYERAIAAFYTALEIDPKNADAYFGLIEVYAAQGNAEELANVYLRAAKELNADTDTAELEKVQKEAVSKLEAMIQDAMETGDYSLAEKYTDLLAKVDEKRAEKMKSQIADGRKMVLSSAETGAYITFGRYEQDNDLTNGAEPIEWQILEREGEKILVISKYALELMPFNKEENGDHATWEECTLREWLNHDFYNSVFNNIERAAIIETRNVTPDVHNLGEYFVRGSNVTTDKIFLLKNSEVEQFYSQPEERTCNGTPYLATEIEKKGFGEGDAFWWLRSTDSFTGNGANTIDMRKGTGIFAGQAHFLGTVRPVMWIYTGDIPENGLPMVSREEQDLLQKGMSENLLKADEITFLGADFAALTIERAKGLIAAAGGIITSNNADFESNDNFDWIQFRLNDGGSSFNNSWGNCGVMQSHNEQFVSSVSYDWRNQFNLINPEVGIRNIKIGDTTAEVMSKLGFHNGDEIQEYFEEYCGQRYTEEELTTVPSSHFYFAIMDQHGSVISTYTFSGGSFKGVDNTNTYEHSSYRLEIYLESGISIKFEFNRDEDMGGPTGVNHILTDVSIFHYQGN